MNKDFNSLEERAKLIEKEVLIDLISNVISVYVTNPSIYNYAYDNSQVFRNFINNSSEDMKKLYNIVRNQNRFKNIRSGIFGLACMTTIFAPIAIGKGISKAIKTNNIKKTVNSDAFNEFFTYLTNNPLECILIDYSLSKTAYDESKRLEEELGG